jgi:hypothetical protein
MLWSKRCRYCNLSGRMRGRGELPTTEEWGVAMREVNVSGEKTARPEYRRG